MNSTSYTRLLLTLFFLTSCLFAESKNNCTIRREKIVKAYVRQKRKDGFFLVTSGGGQLDGKVRFICIGLESDELYDLEQARRLIVLSAYDLFDLIRSYPNFKDLFFNCSNLEQVANLTFYGQYREKIDIDIVDVVGLHMGEVSYCTRRRFIEEGPLLNLSIETFHEACMMVLYEGKTRQREITCYREDDTGEVVEIGGPWGKAIKEVAISQIEQSKVRYFIKEGNEEISLIVTCEAEKSSLSTESGLKPFSQLEHKERL